MLSKSKPSFPDTNFWEEGGTRKRKERKNKHLRNSGAWGRGKGKLVWGREVAGNPGGPWLFITGDSQKGHPEEAPHLHRAVTWVKGWSHVLVRAGPPHSVPHKLHYEAKLQGVVDASVYV